MAGRSFKEYVSKRFEDELFAATEKFILSDRLNTEFVTRRITYPTSTEVDNVHVLSVSVNDLPDMEVEFVITLEAQVNIAVSRSHWDDFDVCYPRIQLKGNGDLDKDLNNFAITGVRLAEKSNELPRPLDDSLVPYMSKGKYEDEVRGFLKRNHYSEMLLEPQAIDPLQLAKRMGLTVLQRRISNDYSIFGEIFFAE